MTCTICNAPKSMACAFCMNESHCSRCYKLTHRHTQRHKFNLFRKTGSNEEPLPEP